MLRLLKHRDGLFFIQTKLVSIGTSHTSGSDESKKFVKRWKLSYKLKHNVTFVETKEQKYCTLM